MLYEVHVTVDSHDVSGWSQLCRQLGIKPVLIELSHGYYPTQLMCSGAHDGDDASAQRYVEGIAKTSAQAGFKPLRIKLERPLYDVDCERSMVYAESHIKIMLPESEQDFVYGLCGPVVFASRSLLGVEPPMVKWYLTQRTQGLPGKSSEWLFQETFARIQSQTEVARMETEAVIYDTNPDLDKGWAHA